MDYAVLRTGGKQYRVAPGDVIRVEKIEANVGDKLRFEDVLLAGAGDDSIRVGSPTVDGASVIGRIVDQGKARKIIVFKKKRRKGYRRKAGHRQHLTTVEILSIEA